MEYRRLGRTDLFVSAICLGTMTWGEQNTEAEACEQMDYAFDHGVTFWDTAEMYPIPPAAETYGRTETIIGNWLKSRGRRDKIILASKIIGRAAGGGFDWVRDGKAKLDRANLVRAIDDSLRRLQTDCIDLYQIHWPDRVTNRFGQRGYRHTPAPGGDGTPLAETLYVLGDMVRSGKIRHVGVSNETPWGVMKYLKYSVAAGFPRIAGIQNAYNLLNRTFEIALSEVAIREHCGLLAYSPLGGGTLSGKYLNGARPPGSRRAIDPRKSRYETPNADAATNCYVHIARRYDLEPTQMALAFVLRQPFVTSAIIGATSMAHLRSNIASLDVRLGDPVLNEIESVQEKYPNPCP